MVLGGVNLSARTVAAGVAGIVILSVSILGVIQGMENIDEQRARADVRRMSSTLEAVDHTPGTVVRLRFAQPYTIELAEDSVTTRGSGPTLRHKINLHSELETRTIRDTDYVCAMNNGEIVTMSTSCDIDAAEPGGGR